MDVVHRGGGGVTIAGKFVSRTLVRQPGAQVSSVVEVESDEVVGVVVVDCLILVHCAYPGVVC